MSALPPVLHLVPRLPPPPDGVGDYALALAAALARHAGIGSRLLSLFEPSETAELPARGLSAAARDALAGELRRAVADDGVGALVLHYSGYGFDDRGCPGWLVAGIEAVPELPLVTMFHEVSATGPPWRSAFWLGGVQRRLARRLARRSARAATSLRLYSDLLDRLAPGRPVEVSPVLSPVGEPGSLPATGERPPRLVVFGGAGNRHSVYRRHGGRLGAICERLGLEEVHDVGPAADAPPELAGRPVVRRGALAVAELRAELLAARAGALAYPPRFFPKSTVFAAYAAHGVAPIGLAGDTRGTLDEGLAAGHHFWTPATGDAATLSSIARAARAWYREHDAAHHAALYARLLREAVAA